jgi:hypothetical protein
MWGVFVYKEVQGNEIIVFFTGGAVLISGAVCIALAS